LFLKPARILEIGSGSGQHAVHMAAALPHLTWQPTDQGEYFAGLLENIERLAPLNVSPPLYLDIATSVFPPTDHIYAANVVHIMPAALLPSLFRGAASALPTGGKLCFYGPFKYLGEFTAESNATLMSGLKRATPSVAFVILKPCKLAPKHKAFTCCQTHLCPPTTSYWSSPSSNQSP